MKKIENYLKAVQRLDEANIEYRKHPDNDVIRDGLIQRFEFTFELAWKASKEYLMDQGFSNDLHFPKQVLRAAYENHMIDDEAVWLKMLSSRNSSSHIYDDRVAAAIAKDIATSFLPVLKKLSGYFKGNTKTHLVGILGGVIWCIGQSFSMIASEKAGAAISYGLGQGATLVSALWGILIWHEFRRAPRSSDFLNAGMFVLFVIGLGFLIYAGA